VTRDHDQSSGSVAPASELDVLSDMLRCVRLTGAMLFLVEAFTPWVSWAPQAEAFRRVVLPAAQHLISLHIVTDGGCWGGLMGELPERFETGDVLVIPHGDAYYLADPPEAQRTYGHDDAVSFFRDMAAGKLPSTVTEGGSGPPAAQFICGFLGCDVRPFNPVLSALPRLLHVRTATSSNDGLSHLIGFALQELRHHRSGGKVVKLRTAELLFVDVIRRYLGTLTDRHTGWLAGLRDPLVARALALLHEAPSRSWTLDALAAQAGTSRSVIAERFVHLIGRPPMQYLRHLRTVGKSSACRRQRQSGVRRSGRRFRIGGCLQSRVQAVRWHSSGRMAATSGTMNTLHGLISSTFCLRRPRRRRQR
jgi:Cupin